MDDRQESTADGFERLLRDRHSTRAFLDEPVPTRSIDRLLRLAQRCPSWCNTQPWTVHLLRGEATGRLSALLLESGPDARAFDIPPPGSYEGVLRDRRRASGFALYESVGIAREDWGARERQSRDNLRFFGAPQVVIVTCPANLGPYAYVDAGAYIAHFVLAATALGLGSVAQAAIAGYSSTVREFLGLPDDDLVVAGIAFGFADVGHPVNNFRTSRAGLDEVVVRVTAPPDDEV